MAQLCVHPPYVVARSQATIGGSTAYGRVYMPADILKYSILRGKGQ